MKPCIAFAFAVVAMTVGGCKREAGSVSKSAPAADRVVEVQREQLKVEREALNLQKREAIDREYKDRIAKADAARDETCKLYLKMLEDGHLSNEKVDAQLKMADDMCEKEHEAASADAVRKSKQLNAEK